MTPRPPLHLASDVHDPSPHPALVVLHVCLTPCPHPQVYSDGLLVQHANPDFSMPYNVICLTSTLLAVYVGATLNTLIKRPQEAAKSAAKARSKWVRAGQVG